MSCTGGGACQRGSCAAGLAPNGVPPPPHRHRAARQVDDQGQVAAPHVAEELVGDLRVGGPRFCLLLLQLPYVKRKADHKQPAGQQEEDACRQQVYEVARVTKRRSGVQRVSCEAPIVQRTISWNPCQQYPGGHVRYGAGVVGERAEEEDQRLLHSCYA